MGIGPWKKVKCMWCGNSYSTIEALQKHQLKRGHY